MLCFRLLCYHILDGFLNASILGEKKLIDVNELFISISGRQGTLPKFNYNFLGSNWLTRLLEKEKI